MRTHFTSREWREGCCQAAWLFHARRPQHRTWLERIPFREVK